MKKSNLFSLIFVSAIATGTPYAVLNHNVAYAGEEVSSTSDTTMKNENSNSENPKNSIESKEEQENENSVTNPTELSNPNASINNILKDAVNTASNLDVKNLKDGEYSLPISVKNFYTGADSMANGAVEKSAKLIVKNGKYSVQLTFKPLEQKMGSNTFKGYLGDLKYYDGDKTGNNIQDSDFKDTKIVESYSTSEKDDYFDTYKKKYPNRTAYPKVLEYDIDKNKIDNNTLNSHVQVFVPVMDLFNAGTQKATVVYDFKNIKTVKLDEAAKTQSSKFVELKVKDDTITTPKVRKNVDTIGKIVKEGDKEYLLLTYYSKVGEDKNNDGIQNIKYSYDEKDTSKLTPETKVVETIVAKGDDNKVYEISEAKIPITGKNQVVIHGDFQYPAGLKGQYGTITWNEKTNLVKEKTNVDAPKLVAIKPVLKGVTIKKDGEAKRELDFSKDGINYSPYNGINGDKFKLADNYFFNIEAAFERTNLVNTKTRHIKYTLDGSEPTFDSKEASVRFANADPHKPEFYYSLSINPYDESSKVPTSGGNLTLKVKSFNADGSESSETKTYTLPFDKESLDSVNSKASVGGTEYDTTLSSNKKFLLDNDVDVKVSNISEKILNQTLDNKVHELGLADAKAFKLDITKKDGSKFTPIDKAGWNIDSNPIFKLKLSKFAADNDTHTYIYENGNLRLIPSSKLKDGYEFNVNSDEAYFVIAKKDTKTLSAEKINELKEKVEEVKKAIASTTNISTAKSNLETELTKIEKTLKRKTIPLNTVLLHLETLDSNLKTLKSDKTADLAYLQKNAAALTKIVDSKILSDLLTTNKLAKLQELKNKVNSSLNTAADLAKNLKDLQNELNNLEYKYPTQDVDFTIKKFYRPNETSMANNVFENKGKLIFTPDKTYLDIDLKTMIFGTMHAHLLELDVFKDKIDGEKLPYHVVNKYDDLSSLTGEIGNFDKKLLVELEKNVKNSYDIRVPNDGMGTSRPEAKLVISTAINRPEVPSDNEKAEKERLEKEKAEQANREKAEKERLEKEKAEQANREKAEKERLEKEKAGQANHKKEIKKPETTTQDKKSTKATNENQSDENISKKSSSTKILAKTGLNTSTSFGVGILGIFSALLLNKKQKSKK
ncbi:NEAT domain-containing protein [Gemella cuniculi]|uniref:NEAT domain-containing protein n=1 Tax=Gemella cuniculi TaxID=150240 RepID=UPI0004224B3A|nr:NEAT domain-containing protein [Gemella cuniculi]